MILHAGFQRKTYDKKIKLYEASYHEFGAQSGDLCQQTAGRLVKLTLQFNVQYG